MSYLHPLAYLLGVEGLALLRSFIGDFDRDFAEARLAEIRRLLDDPSLSGAGLPIGAIDTVGGYQIWARSYDRPGNGAFPYEEPYLRRLIAQLPPCAVLDAACGTGRYADYAATLGHHVIGVDSSPDMLARARTRVPTASFRHGNLSSLPLRDNEVDAVVCALALTHVAELGPVIAEFARVLRPGGHLFISDMHESSVLRGSVPKMELADGTRARIATHRHLTGDYLRAALSNGFQVRACQEPIIGADTPMPASDPRTTTEEALSSWHDWPWSLSDLVPQAAWAASQDRPATIIWHFQLP